MDYGDFEIVKIVRHLDTQYRLGCFKISNLQAFISDDIPYDLSLFRRNSYWELISRQELLTLDFIDLFKDRIDYSALAINVSGTLTEEVVDRYINKLNIKFLSTNSSLSEKIIIKYSDILDLNSLISCKKMSEDFLKTYAPRLSFYTICRTQKLSEEFIREHLNQVSWGMISQHQTLSEEFIEEFQKKVDWSKIALCQNISEPFIKKYSEKLNPYNLKFNPFLKREGAYYAYVGV